MIDKRFEGESLSGEEIRGLLGGDELSEDSSAPVTAHMMLVSRRDDDVRLIRSRLETHGVAVTVVRNPFTALDQLRRARYEGVLSDLDLWANEGELLLDRVPRVAVGTPILFLGGGGVEAPEELEKRLVQHGAWGILPRPLQPTSLEKTVGDFVSRCLDAGAPSPQGDPCSRDDSGTADDQPLSPLSRDANTAGELAWLRFFFHAGRALRQKGDLRRHSSGDSPFRTLARVAREHLKARAVSVVVEENGELGAFVAGGEPGDSAALLEELAAVGRADSTPEGIAVQVDEGGRRKSLTLLDLPAEVRGAAQAFLTDLRELLLLVPEN